MSFNSADELSNNDALRLIREIAEFGSVISTGHVKEQMEDRGYLMHDVLYILMHGKIVDKEFNDRTKNWKYVVRGDDLDGEEGAVVTAIVRRDAIVLITVLGG